MNSWILFDTIGLSGLISVLYFFPYFIKFNTSEVLFTLISSTPETIIPLIGSSLISGTSVGSLTSKSFNYSLFISI